MKRRANLVVAERLQPARREGVARTLLDMLQSRFRYPPEGGVEWRLGRRGDQGNGPVEVTLVGHSMGAIVLNRLIASLPATFPLARVVSLAPAASRDETEAHVRPYLRHGGAGTVF